MTNVLLIAIQRLQQLQGFPVQQEQWFALGENQFQRDFRKRITENGQLDWCGVLAHN